MALITISELPTGYTPQGPELFEIVQAGHSFRVSATQIAQFVSGFIGQGGTSGSYIPTSQSGLFYPASNPSGFVTGVNTGTFYPSSNPSGFITGVLTGNLTGVFYPLNSNPASYLTGFNSGLYVLNSQTGIFITTGLTGLFYPANNPSNFISSSQTGQFASLAAQQADTTNISAINAATGNFSTIFVTTGQSGLFYPSHGNPSGYLTSGSAIAGAASVNSLTGIIIISGLGGNTVTTSGQYILITETSGQGTGNYITPSQTGIFVTTGQTGQFQPTGNYYSSNNPSGFITGFNSGLYVLNSQTGIFYLNSNPSGYITGINTGNFITSSQTGQFAPLVLEQNNATNISSINSASGNFPNIFLGTGQSGLFYPASNPNGFITGIPTGNLTGAFYPLNSNPSSYLTGFNSGLYTLNSQTGIFVTTGQTGQFASLVAQQTDATNISNINSATGNFPTIFLTTGQSGLFYPKNNPSGFITGLNTGNFVTNGQTGVFATTGQLTSYVLSSATGVLQPSGNYYLASNPSGFITGLNTGSFITVSQTGQFAPLVLEQNNATNISNINSATGIFLTIGYSNYILTGNQTVNLSGLNSINNFYITYTGASGNNYTGNLIVQASGVNNQIDRLMINLSGQQTINIYSQNTGNLLFYWTGDNTVTFMEIESSYSGIGWNLDNANFIN